MKKYFIGICIGILLTVSGYATAGWLSSTIGGAVGGAVGASVANSGVEGKVDSINHRIDLLIRALDSVKVCK